MFLIVPWTSRNYVRVSESGADIKCISYPIIILRKHHEHNEWWWNIMKHQLEKRTKHSWPATTKQNSSETNHLALCKNIRKTPKTIPILRKSWQKSHSLHGKMAIKLWHHRGKSTIFAPNPRGISPRFYASTSREDLWELPRQDNSQPDENLRHQQKSIPDNCDYQCDL